MSQAEQFIEMVAEVFGVEKSEITDDKTPEDIENWTSITHMDLMARFEEAFGTEFDVEEITEMDSIEAMKKALKNHKVDV
ncbi:MAG: acyl carrier protein [archaeon]|nr:acyl carrier protein [archaeon]